MRSNPELRYIEAFRVNPETGNLELLSTEPNTAAE